MFPGGILEAGSTSFALPNRGRHRGQFYVFLEVLQEMTSRDMQKNTQNCPLCLCVWRGTCKRNTQNCPLCAATGGRQVP